MTKVAPILALLVALTGCSLTPPVTPRVMVAHAPPTAKDVIRAVYALHDRPLISAHACNGVGTEPEDRTLGDFLSGFEASFSERQGENRIEITVELRGNVWRCRYILRRRAGEEVWGWGIQFDVRQSDRVVLPETITCIGAG